MTAAGTLLSTSAGVALIGLVGRDAFDALFHAEGRGMFSRQITRAVWQTFRHVGARHERLSLAGPVAFVAVIATWAGLLVLGWALVFWPHMPGDFRFDAGLDARARTSSTRSTSRWSRSRRWGSAISRRRLRPCG